MTDSLSHPSAPCGEVPSASSTSQTVSHGGIAPTLPEAPLNPTHQPQRKFAVNPAALSAAMRGDLANAIVASTPGGIEAQEAAGQAQLVASGAMLPKDMGYQPPKRKQVTAATGIQFGADADDLFVNVTLPPGWKLKATNHSMWSDLLDADGAKRAGVFYKAAFYDRNAHIDFNRRYVLDCDYAEPTSTVTVKDAKTGAVLFTAGSYAAADYRAPEREAANKAAQQWLDKHFPEHADPFAYWA